MGWKKHEDVYDAWYAQKGFATSRSLWKARALEAEAELHKKLEQETPYYEALTQCFARYEQMATRHEIEQLVAFMKAAQTAIVSRGPLRELNHWLGYVQGFLISRKITTVRAEHNWTRSLFRSLGFPEAPEEPGLGDGETPVDWLWWGRDTEGVEHTSFGRWQSHGCQHRYKLAAVQPTEHDHPNSVADPTI